MVQLKAHHAEFEYTQSSLETNFCHSMIHFKGNQVDLEPNLLDANFCHSMIHFKGNQTDLTPSLLDANFCHSIVHLKGNQTDLTPSLLDANFCHSIVHLKGNQTDLTPSLLDANFCHSIVHLKGNQVDLALLLLQGHICRSLIRLRANKVDLTQSSLEALLRLSAIRLRGNKVELFDTALFCRGKENTTILSSRAHAMIAKPRIYRLPFRQKCVGDVDLPHVADPENPLQLQADDVDSRTEDDNDNTDKKDEVLAESFAVIRGWLTDIWNCLTRRSEAKPEVTVNLFRCKHVQIGEILNRHCSVIQCHAVGYK